MKKLFALALAASMLFSTTGCMVATNQTLVVPVSSDSDAPALMTYYGQAVSPFIFPDMPGGKDINVVKLDQAGAAIWAQDLTQEDVELFRNTLNASLDADLKAFNDSMRDSAADAQPVMTTDEILQDAQNQMNDQAEALEGLSEEEQALMMDLVSEVGAEMMNIMMEEQQAIVEAALLTYGPTLATYNLTNAQKRINAHYPGKTITGAYTLLMTDANGIYPATGKAENIYMEMPLGEGDKANQVAIIATNGAIVSRQAKVVGDKLCFTVPSTLGTLILILE